MPESYKLNLQGKVPKTKKKNFKILLNIYFGLKEHCTLILLLKLSWLQMASIEIWAVRCLQKFNGGSEVWSLMCVISEDNLIFCWWLSAKVVSSETASLKLILKTNIGFNFRQDRRFRPEIFESWNLWETHQIIALLDFAQFRYTQ